MCCSTHCFLCFGSRTLLVCDSKPALNGTGLSCRLHTAAIEWRKGGRKLCQALYQNRHKWGAPLLRLPHIATAVHLCCCRTVLLCLPLTRRALPAFGQSGPQLRTVTICNGPAAGPPAAFFLCCMCSLHAPALAPSNCFSGVTVMPLCGTAANCCASMCHVLSAAHLNLTPVFPSFSACGSAMKCTCTTTHVTALPLPAEKPTPRGRSSSEALRPHPYLHMRSTDMQVFLVYLRPLSICGSICM